jgi:hypothetical protein
VPLESGEEVRWRGLYWSKGEGATMLAGKMSDVPEDAVILSHGLTGEGAGYVPISNIESEVTLRIMEKTGYPSETVQNVRDVRAIMGITQDTKSKFIEDLLPSRTRTLSESGVSTLKEFVLSNDEQVEELYGSFATKPQVSKEFEYILETETGSISALREPGDIDIQLKVGQEGAVKFTKDLAARLQDAGEDVRVSPERAILIETRVDLDKYAHAVDIHFKGEEADLMNPMSERAWGFTLQRAKVKIENIELMGASEQGLRKGVSILGFTEEQGLGPVAHRLKDIPDFFQVQETLLESKSDMQGQILLARLEPRFGVKDLADTDVIIQERYLVSPASQASKASLVLSVGISAALMAKQSMAMSKSSYTLSPYINLGASKLLESSVKLPSSFLNLQSSKTTVPSMPSTKLFVPTSPSLSSVFSLPKGSPSIPSSPSIPRYPSPSHPSPSYPTYPSNKQYMDILKKDFTPFKRKGGNWARRYMWEFPVKGPKELLKVV